jgi:carboxylesterase type B
MAGMAVFTAAFVWLLCFPWTTLTQSTDNSRPNATIDSGVVLGITKSDNASGVQVDAFLGIPFAGQPVRWAPPKPPAPWKQPFDASKYGPACVQQFNYPAARRDLILQWFNTPAPQESEDCLNVCVYAPTLKDKAKLKAVMVWLYGGGLLYGSNAIPHYDGSTLAANEDVIVVVVNYVGLSTC